MITEDAIQRLIDIEDIKRLKARYFWCLDHQDWAGMREVITDDMRWESPSGVRTGRDEFVSYLEAALGGRAFSAHHGMNPEITITGPDTASGTWAMCDSVRPLAGPAVVGPTGGFRGYGRYEDEYVRSEDGWRIRRSTLVRYQVDHFPAMDRLPDDS